MRTTRFARRFEAIDPALLPLVLERLRGTPARLEERVRELPAELARARSGEHWSIQRNVGHLGDLEPLWLGRIEDFRSAAASLRPADLENRRTEEADHDATPLERLLATFRSLRATLVTSLESLPEAVLGRSAPHPRLKVPMRIADLAFFVAEHDDHHLARITILLREAGRGSTGAGAPDASPRRELPP